ncbi:type 1 glutamine amidotransferase domain-containing protein [Xanthomonas campestris]|uniref:type 1 glutamine amidotransferase domain-containing protein n=1 Tax=Xanthomonas campestris TaxID=339 RepID=UPI000E1F515C|nr:type 1 glutamine amidotransferase domain-containing protein [Xanthomonas campestris]
MNVLMVLTSHDQLGDTGKKTGFWLEEFAAPYYVFKDAGAQITLVSPKGGQPPLDPKSDEPDAQTEATKRFKPVSYTHLDVAFATANKPHGLVCHAPGALRRVKGADGKPLVNGRRVTGFTNGEEEGVGLTKIVPFLVEDVLIELGGQYEKGADWGVHVVTDGMLVTGQNPASSEKTAETLLSLGKR